MKKLLALTLALAMCVATFSACSSDGNTDEQISSLSEEEGEKLLQENFDESYSIYEHIQLAIQNLKHSDDPYPLDGIYRFSIDGSLYNQEIPDFKSDSDYSTTNRKCMSQEDTELYLKYISARSANSGEAVVVIDGNSVVEVYYSDSVTSNYATGYPKPAREAPSYTIDNIPNLGDSNSTED